MKLVRAFPLVALFGVISGHTAAPSFDCTKTDSAAAEQVCEDKELAALDQELTRLFALAKNGPHITASRRKELIATQRSWIKGRDECWKGRDLRRCVMESYVMRIHELRQGYADARSQDSKGISQGPLVVWCDRLDALIGLTFIGNTPKHAYLEWLDQSIITTLEPSGSGSRYTAHYDDGAFVFWIKGDVATFERPQQGTLNCRIAEPG